MKKTTKDSNKFCKILHLKKLVQKITNDIKKEYQNKRSNNQNITVMLLTKR